MDAVKAQTLKVGDTIPPELWNMPLQVINHPTGKETLALSEYKDKLIILDFWATWCSPCIKSLNKLDTLQREFVEHLAVIPITSEVKEKVLPLLTKRGWILPSVITDETLGKFFPYRSIPHLVWLSEGKVFAVTNAEYSQRDIIASVLASKPVSMKMKVEDMLFDPTALIQPAEGIIVESGILNRVNISNSGTRISPYGFVYFNASIDNLLRTAYKADHSFLESSKRIVSELPILSNAEKDGSFFHNKNSHTYYVRYSSKQSRKTVFRKMQDDLKSYLALSERCGVTIERRDVKCLILKQISPIETHFDTDQITVSLERIFDCPVLNEVDNKSEYTLGSNMDIPKEQSAVLQWLSAHNLKVIEEVRSLEMMIIKPIEQ